MKTKSKDGPFVLLEVKHAFARPSNSLGLAFHDIRGEGRQLCATALHVFLGSRDGSEVRLKGNEIRSGDSIWVDRSAFTADGSLRSFSGGSRQNLLRR